MSESSKTIPVFMPALGIVLVAAEDKKGNPLDKEEVEDIRDNAACIMMEESDAAEMTESRGFIDIDPENCWYDWQMLRRELGRKPDLDLGARVNFMDSGNLEYQLTISKAKETLDTFRSLFEGREPWAPLVKTELAHAGGRCFVWLNNVQITNDGFVAQIFEIPPSLEGFEIGDSVIVDSEDVLDWMINDNGTLHGGYSLRYHRDRLPEHERSAFDEHLGVQTYA